MRIATTAERWSLSSPGSPSIFTFGDHPPPHFHVRFQGHKAAFEIGSCRVLAGRLPASVLGKVVHWARENEELLRARWAEGQSKG
jgi:hypothetical protein